MNESDYDRLVTRVVALIAGASGSGKTRLARLTGWPRLRLDDFYLAATDPAIPRSETGVIDWDDIRTFDTDSAAQALVTLARDGVVTAPVYSIADNAPVGVHIVDATDAPVIVAEGIFATAMLAVCKAHDIPVIAIWLDRGRWITWARRLRRDIRDHRKPLGVLWRRGIALRRAEPALRREAIEAGFTPMTMRQACAALSASARSTPA